MRLSVVAGLAVGAVTLTLYSLFEGGAWFWACVGTLLVTTGGAALASRFDAPKWAVPPLLLLATAVFLSATFAKEHTWAWVVPTKASALRLGELLAEGFTDIQRYAVPVPAEPGISMLTASGVGLIAILVDLFAVRLRRAALAGLPLLGLFTVPAAVLTEPVAWPAFVIAAIGYVGLLVADGRERLTQWGRAVLVRRARSVGTDKADSGRLALSGKRIGATAIALAVVLPALLPALSPDPLFGFGVGNGSGKGGNSIGIPDAIAKLSGQLSQQRNLTVLTYTSADNRPRYLRIYALDVFDGKKWTVSPLRGRPEDRVSEGPLPPPTGLGPGIATNRVESRISVSEDIGPLLFLPLPYPAVEVDVDGDWRADQASRMVFSTRDEAAGLDYRVVVNEPRPTRDQLDTMDTPTPDARFLALPDLDPKVVAMAGRVTAKGATPYQKAVLLQEWFTRTGGFSYSLETKGSGGSALSRFILTARTGYCEQFASAMAVMARVIGIPARVSIGYTGGTKIEKSWAVRTQDAHAWPELYFEGVGWLPFEPTPAGGAGQGTARVPDYSLPRPSEVTPSADPSAGPTSDEEDTSSQGPTRRNPRDFERDLGAVPVAVDPGMPVAAKIALGAVGVLLLSLVPAAARTLVRRRRHAQIRRGGAAPAIRAAWAELCDTLTDLGEAREPSESPRALARRLTEMYEFDAEAAAAVTAVATAEERMRYAASPPSAGPAAAELSCVRRALMGAVPGKRRMGALLAPRSILLRVRAAGTRVLDGFDRLEGIRWLPLSKGEAGTR
ncbi:transglutaminaseTgpA domain-containing protein [Microtetraspora malaysiensis]|uniref:transglutaminase family protein n=1 Tax=Microtetraspora malaysiensis TaxID=161358 RepID=UPI003D8A0654